MADPHDALARFRAVADAAVEQGRRAVGEARESGAAFDREFRLPVQRARDDGHARRGEGAHNRVEPVDADLRAAAEDYRVRAGLPVPDVPGGLPDGAAAPPDGAAAPPKPGPDDEDFSQLRIMHKL